MSIGMFSRASLVSVKALRAYHERGLLIPAHIDPSSNFRNYRVSQLPDAVLIKRLRDLDVPLRDIRVVIDARDPAVTRKVVAAHEERMRERLAAVTVIVEELQEAVRRPELQTSVHVRTVEQHTVLGVTGRVADADYGAFLDGAYGTLFGALAISGAVPTGPPMALYPPRVELEEEEITAAIPVAVPVDGSALPPGVVVQTWPTVTVAAATHHGGYESIGQTYAQLGAWVARHAESAERHVREQYLVGPAAPGESTIPPADFRTQILWPIVADPAATA